MRKNSAFSGLEGAIVLIAFVVVASVFSYVVLGAGFFAADKSQTSVHEGVKTAQASVYQEGGIYGTLDVNGQLDKLMFTIYIAESSLEQDLEGMTISYTQSDINNPREYTWGATGPSGTEFYSGGMSILYPGKNVKIELDQVQGPKSGGWFAIEIRPKRGSTLFIKRWLGSGYDGGLII